jgi:hypothetical protein|tara:strand:- start:227 stop:445 length:219 start_codon:yes stop_codon:yes gene_type:complete
MINVNDYLLDDSCIDCGILDFESYNNTLKESIFLKKYTHYTWPASQKFILLKRNFKPAERSLKNMVTHSIQL